MLIIVYVLVFGDCFVNAFIKFDAKHQFIDKHIIISLMLEIK